MLGAIGLPQIVLNFRLKEKGIHDLAISSFLIWFSAACLLSAVSIGQALLAGAVLHDMSTPIFWWNFVNLLGVAQSAIVVAQILYYRRDASDLKKTALTAALTALLLVPMAAQAFLSLTAWLNLVFAGAVALLWVLNYPQISQSYHSWNTERHIPEGISPLSKLLVLVGSLLHFYAAVVGLDIRWMMNGIVSTLGSAIVLAQIYAPQASNDLLGPLILGIEGSVMRPKKKLAAVAK